jgi:hypothetical protein
MARRVLRNTNDGLTVATEQRFESEARLHDAIAMHPEVLPSEDLGLGPLVALGQELDFGHGPLDLLAVDAGGRLAIIEFKRGTENSDVRRVVAQLIDYGAGLWRRTTDDLVERINRSPHPLTGTLVQHVAQRMEAIDAEFDAETFEQGFAASLDRGDFVFVYVARDLDTRTRNVMTYLAEGPRMTFFAVEVDYFTSSQPGESIMVPRTAFVPTWRMSSSGAASAQTSAPVSEQLEAATADVREVVHRLEEAAPGLGLFIDDSKKARQFRPQPKKAGISVFPELASVYWDIGTLRAQGRTTFADRLQRTLTDIGGKPATDKWPGISCADALLHWQSAEQPLIIDYFKEMQDIYAVGGAAT